MSQRESSEGNQVDASVLVPVLNEAPHIRETVTAMQGQEFDGRLEFLFMDGRSDDRTREILEELASDDPRIRVLDNPGRTTAKALNVGLENARGTYVARMDAHTFYPSRYIAAGVERLSRNDVDWVAGPAIPHGEGRWSRRVALALNSGISTVGSRKWRQDDEASTPEIELDTGVFAGVWRRETLERHGGWNPDWPINQDSELAARVLASGGRIVLLPEMGARYIPRDSLKGLARQYFRYGFYRAKTSRYHPDAMRRSHLMAPGVAGAAVLSVAGPRPVALPARAVVGAYAAGILAASAREAVRGRPGDALGLPVVYSIMHLAWGFGCLASWLRFGPPLAALARVAGIGRST